MNYYFQAFQNYATFSGRSRRSEYWYFFLFNFIAVFVLAFIGTFAGIPQITYVYRAAVFIPSLAVGVRRMHDVGKSGWFLLIPIYNIILLATEGDKAENKYGADPKAQIM